MPLITWSNSLSVNVLAMDQEHKRLVGIVNDLHAAMKEGKGNEVVGKTLDDLVEYVKKHFADEETLLAARKYPGLLGQQRAHAKLTEQVLAYQSRFRGGGALITVELMQFLKQWLVDHIQGMDKEYGVWLGKKENS
jgi:hemerythrin